MDEILLDICLEGRAIDAIKIYRLWRRIPLKEAKVYVEAILAEHFCESNPND